MRVKGVASIAKYCIPLIDESPLFRQHAAMGRRSSTSANAALSQHQRSRAPYLAFAGLLGAGITAAGFMAFHGLSGPEQSSGAAKASHKSQEFKAASGPSSLYNLLAMTPDELGKVDIALMNLLCAQGLPGAESLDIPATLAKLDEWAAKVKSETQRHLYRVKDPKYTEHYRGSEARLQAEFIVQVLQEDCGVRYNERRIYNPNFASSPDLFIHGLLPGGDGGTCASMPVIYVAIGRRLGYPMKLVQAREHLFCRWDGGGERINVEGASNGGVSYLDDDHYRTWPKQLTDEDIASGVFLTSMTATQELSVFLHDRGICSHANGRLVEARAAFAESHRMEPRSQNTFTALRIVCGVGRSLGASNRNPSTDAWLKQFMVPEPDPRPQAFPGKNDAPVNRHPHPDH